MFTSHRQSEAKSPARQENARASSQRAENTPTENHVWQSLALNLSIQPKLAISQPDDPYEREADRAADQVMRMSIPNAGESGPSLSANIGAAVHRKCDECEEEEEQKVQRREDGAGSKAVETAPSIVHETLDSPGQPLDSVTREFMESRFKNDFSGVRVHTNAQADASARSLNSLAFTLGRNVAFRAGQYSPNTYIGRRLLAHELAHVMQAAEGSRALKSEPAISQSSHATGNETARIAHEGIGAAPFSGPATKPEPTLRQTSATVYRQPAPSASAAAAPSAAPAAPAFTQAEYDAAVAMLASRNPAAHNILRQAVVGSTVRVRSHHFPVAGATAGEPTAIDIFFDLSIRAGGATTGAPAQFHQTYPVVNMTPPTGTITQQLTFTVNAPPPGTNATATLAEYLFHESLHMLLKMDRTMENYAAGAPGTQTGTKAAFEAYKRRGMASSNFLPLSVDLETVIGAYFTSHPNVPGAPTTLREYRRMAQEVFDRIIEERFAVDEQRRQFPGGAVAGATNDAISRGYMQKYLADDQVILPRGDTNLIRLISEMTAVLNDIPLNLGATPATPSSPGATAPPASSAPPPPASSAQPPPHPPQPKP